MLLTSLASATARGNRGFHRNRFKTRVLRRKTDATVAKTQPSQMPALPAADTTRDDFGVYLLPFLSIWERLHYGTIADVRPEFNT